MHPPLVHDAQAYVERMRQLTSPSTNQGPGKLDLVISRSILLTPPLYISMYYVENGEAKQRYFVFNAHRLIYLFNSIRDDQRDAVRDTYEAIRSQFRRFYEGLMSLVIDSNATLTPSIRDRLRYTPSHPREDNIPWMRLKHSRIRPHPKLKSVGIFIENIMDERNEGIANVVRAAEPRIAEFEQAISQNNGRYKQSSRYFQDNDRRSGMSLDNRVFSEVTAYSIQTGQNLAIATADKNSRAALDSTRQKGHLFFSNNVLPRHYGEGFRIDLYGRVGGLYAGDPPHFVLATVFEPLEKFRNVS